MALLQQGFHLVTAIEKHIQLSMPRKANTGHSQSRQNFHTQRQWDSRCLHTKVLYKKGAEQEEVMREADRQKVLQQSQR